MNTLPQETDTIGVLVVHGIGAQEKGDTVVKLLRGLARVEPTLAIDDAADEKPVMLGDQRVRFYEVYWADLLRGEKTFGSFQMKELQSLSWFPLLNSIRRVYKRGNYSFVKIVWWAVVLPIVNFLIYLAYLGGNLVAEVVSSFRRPRESTRVEDASTVQGVLRKVAGDAHKYTLLDEVLDEFVGDILNYVNSAGDAFFRGEGEPPVPDDIRDVYRRILARFHAQLRKAYDDGCATIQVVAHSLGTVVTYHALRDETASMLGVRDRVSRIYTIGSPLEKIRFFWPKLMHGGSPEDLHVEWDNFVSWFDPVAGWLRRFDAWGKVRNHRLLGGGFIRGHVVYERSPVFLRTLTRGLGGRALRAHQTAWQRFKDYLVLFGETLLAPVAIAVLLAFGVMIVAASVALLPFLVGIPLGLFVPGEILGRIKDIASVVIGIAVLVVMVFGPSIRASRVHREFWATPSG